MTVKNTALLLCFALSASPLFAQSAPSVDVFKQVLTKKMQKLTPSGMTERQVVFQNVRAGSPTGASYPFLVTAQIRDYGPGYPPNRYYGTTCVSRFDEQRFSLYRNDMGDWDVEGALTPNLATQQCKQNPAAGVSAIPLNTLQGSLAPAGNPPPAAPPANSANRTQTAAGAGAITSGKYECWANGQARLLLNFTATGPGQYIGADGQRGAYTSGANGRIDFTSGSLHGIMEGYSAIFYAPGGRPTVSFRSPRGSEVSFCQLVR